MAQATKSSPKNPSRGREVLGIFLVAFSIFACLALISMQAGNNRLVGPGGAATAAGLYTLAGFGAYLIVAGLAVVAVRCFRHARPIDGLLEGAGAFGVLCASAVLLHLPFAGKAHALRGPGGLLGQWLGEVTASFIGGPGAALAAAALLATSLLVITNVSAHEVSVVVAWGLRRLGAGAWACCKAGGRVLVAMFPEREPTDVEKQEPDGHGDAETGDRAVRANDDDDDGDDDVGARREPDGLIVHPQDGAAAPSAMDAAGSEAVRAGEPTAISETHMDGGAASTGVPAAFRGETPSAGIEPASPFPLADDHRSHVAALVAEVAAAEPAVADSILLAAGAQVMAASVSDDGTAAVAEAGIPLPAAAPDTEPVVEAAVEPAPIIVEPANRARLMEKDEAPPAVVESVKTKIEDGPGFIKLGAGDFELPSLDMLDYTPPPEHDTDKQALYDMAARLEQAMANYKVKGKVREIHMGPVVTMYEFQPAPGTRVAGIMNLENDLAMALEVPSVRVAPLPNKGVVGVEVPNKTRETVYLKEILVDECFAGARSKLEIGLGKDIKGAPISVNLAKMPHLLVAGTTGSGKSVTVNGMISSILCNATPDEVRFIMVDPKMLEFSAYEGIPHLLLPVVTDPKKANLALRWAVDEMERRYELLAKSGVRDIAGYNTKVDGILKAGDAVPEAVADTPSARERAKRLKVVITAADGSEQEVEMDADGDAGGVPDAEAAEELSAKQAAAQAAKDAAAAEPKPRKLPYIVIVIDEFADLMMVAPKDVETSVARIAQKARAAGLHLILATQRPSVDVITGLIKANFPSRIALQVASKIDSRTILDQPGAETLLGNGDMLFSDRGTKLKRIHGAFLSDPEVHRIVEFLKTQGRPVYDMDILKPREEENAEGGEAGGEPENRDAMYDQAVALVCESRIASVSYIQRRLAIGYNRAARMVEQMEKDGIVGPANGAKPRDVVAPPGGYSIAPSPSVAA